MKYIVALFVVIVGAFAVFSVYSITTTKESSIINSETTEQLQTTPSLAPQRPNTSSPTTPTASSKNTWPQTISTVKIAGDVYIQSTGHTYDKNGQKQFVTTIGGPAANTKLIFTDNSAGTNKQTTQTITDKYGLFSVKLTPGNYHISSPSNLVAQDIAVSSNQPQTLHLFVQQLNP